MYFKPTKVRRRLYRYYDIPELEPTSLDTYLFVLFIASLFIALILVIIYGYLWNIRWCKKLVQKSKIFENFILDYRGYFNARPFTTLLHGLIIHPGCVLLISKYYTCHALFSYAWLRAWGDDTRHFCLIKAFWNQDSYDYTPEMRLRLCGALYLYMLYFIRIHYNKEPCEYQVVFRLIFLIFFNVGMLRVIPYIPDFIFIGDPVITKLYAMMAIKQEIQLAVLDTKLSSFLHGPVYYGCLVFFNVFKVKCLFFPAATFRNFKNNFKNYKAVKKTNPDMKTNYKYLVSGLF